MKNFKFKTSTDPSGLAHYLTTLADAVASGRLPVMSLDRELCLQPKGLVDLAVKVRRKKDRTLVVLEMSWAETETDSHLLSDPCKTT